jgi:hypothetical protein
MLPKPIFTAKRRQIVLRADLKQRDFDVNLDAKHLETKVITSSTGLKDRGGWYCETCDCLLKDSMSSVFVVTRAHMYHESNYLAAEVIFI